MKLLSIIICFGFLLVALARGDDYQISNCSSYMLPPLAHGEDYLDSDWDLDPCTEIDLRSPPPHYTLCWAESEPNEGYMYGRAIDRRNAQECAVEACRRSSSRPSECTWIECKTKYNLSEE